MFFNRLEIIGFTGADCNVRYTANGAPYAFFSVATKDSWRDANGDWQERTEWIRCVCFGSEDFVVHAATFTKGTHVFVAGQLRSREYTKDGVQHRVWECRVETLRRLDRTAQAIPTQDSAAEPGDASTEVPL